MKSENTDTGRTDFGNRLLLARKHAKKTQVQAAKAVGMSQSTLGELEREGKGSSYTTALAAYYGVNPYWLADNVGSMLQGAHTTFAPMTGGGGDYPPTLLDLDAHPDIAAVRRVKFRLQAGVQGYAIELDGGSGPPIFFRRDWLRDRGYRPDKLVAIRVTGQSMEPTLHDSDLVVVNTADSEPVDGETYAVNYEGEMGVKRLRRDSGEWWLCSDHPDQRRYAPKRCTDDVVLLGRVIYKQSEHV